MKTLLLTDEEFEFINFIITEASERLDLLQKTPMAEILNLIGQSEHLIRDPEARRKFDEMKQMQRDSNDKTKRTILSIRTKCEIAASSNGN